VIPPANSALGIVFDAPFSLSNTAPIRLLSRVEMHGRVVDQAGNPISGISVTARPSLRFRWSLDSDPQQFLRKVPDATYITSADGTFIVWVDGLVGDIYSGYDLELDAPAGSPVPSWFVTDIQMPRPVPDAIYLPDIAFPDAAFVHGTIVDSAGLMVPGGELRIFKVDNDMSLCDMVPRAPTDCTIPAQVLGHGTSDDVGVVKLTLPRQ
jgi:hypothetical protein